MISEFDISNSNYDWFSFISVFWMMNNNTKFNLRMNWKNACNDSGNCCIFMMIWIIHERFVAKCQNYLIFLSCILIIIKSFRFSSISVIFLVIMLIMKDEKNHQNTFLQLHNCYFVSKSLIWSIIFYKMNMIISE